MKRALTEAQINSLIEKGHRLLDEIDRLLTYIDTELQAKLTMQKAILQGEYEPHRFNDSHNVQEK